MAGAFGRSRFASDRGAINALTSATPDQITRKDCDERRTRDAGCHRTDKSRAVFTARLHERVTAGGADAGIPVAIVEALKAALAANHKTAEFKIYPDAPHGFHADYRASSRKKPPRTAGTGCGPGSSSTRCWAENTRH
jgi:dienelactone hydrolase